MGIQYREAGASDAEQIALLHAKSWQCSYRGVLCDKFLDNDVAENRLAHWQQRYNYPQKLDRSIRCMIACKNIEEARQNAQSAEAT